MLRNMNPKSDILKIRKFHTEFQNQIGNRVIQATSAAHITSSALMISLRRADFRAVLKL